MEEFYSENIRISIALQKGEEVKCPICNKGIIKAINDADPATCHGFYCTKCEYKLHWDPQVIIE